MSCCNSCHVGAPCEGDEHVGCASPVPVFELVGDTGRDVGKVVATVDRAIGDTVANVFRGGSLDAVAQLHDARMAALEKHAPEFYGQPAAPAPAAPASPFLRIPLNTEGMRRQLMADPAEFRAAQQRRTEALEAVIAELRAKTARAIAGDAGERAYFRELKVKSDAGDLDARRRLAAAATLAPRGRVGR